MNLVILKMTLLLLSCTAYIIEPGPKVKSSVGDVWPKPLRKNITSDVLLSINLKSFEFEIVGNTCDILEEAIIRYENILESTLRTLIRFDSVSISETRPLEKLKINLISSCEYIPVLNMDESYTLDTFNAELSSASIWGILRGLETFSQLAAPSPTGKEILLMRSVQINDEPRFAHRGFLLDTSRHWMSMDTIYKIIDGLAYNKLNVFHWHIIDDHAFPYRSRKYPELAEAGAYRSHMTYSEEDIANVKEYCRLRGIRILVEIDVPGHTRSWGNSHPEILTTCEGDYEGMLGPIDPLSKYSFPFLQELFKEITDIFPEKYLHLGGDEVGFECWESNKAIRDYVKTKNITYTDLQRLFMQDIANYAVSLGKIPIVWQEAMVESVIYPKNTIVQVWTGNWRNLVKQYTADHHPVLLSECWYLSDILNGGDWQKFYLCEPHNFIGSDEQKKLVLGGEACMWGEYVNNNNILQRVFPRVSAIAERLWSERWTMDLSDAQQRLEEHTCRMNVRGIPAQPPNGPGIC